MITCLIFVYAVFVTVFTLYYAKKDFLGRVPSQFSVNEYKNEIKATRKEMRSLFFVNFGDEWETWSSCDFFLVGSKLVIIPTLPFNIVCRGWAFEVAELRLEKKKIMYLRKRIILKIPECNVRIAVPGKISHIFG